MYYGGLFPYGGRFGYFHVFPSSRGGSKSKAAITVFSPLFFPGAAVNCVGQRAAEMGRDSIDILDFGTTLKTTSGTI